MAPRRQRDPGGTGPQGWLWHQEHIGQGGTARPPPAQVLPCQHARQLPQWQKEMTDWICTPQTPVQESQLAVW